jgi:hypothetical protein
VRELKIKKAKLEIEEKIVSTSGIPPRTLRPGGDKFVAANLAELDHQSRRIASLSKFRRAV